MTTFWWIYDDNGWVKLYVEQWLMIGSGKYKIFKSINTSNEIELIQKNQGLQKNCTKLELA